MKKLRTFFTALLMVVFTISTVNSQSNFHNIHYLDPYNPEYVKGEVLVKFKDKVEVESSFKSGIAKTGISSVDKVLEPYQTEAIEKVFKETREQRSRKTVRTIRDFKGNEIEVPSLFNIYKLKFDTIWDAKQIIEDLQKDPNIEYAELNYLVYTSEVMKSIFIHESPSPPNSVMSPQNRIITPNDPLYNQQAGLFTTQINQVWDTITGDSTQIIAILDTGVDWLHPDLSENTWNNSDEISGNGIDDDNNGKIDDIRGWDFINNDNNPMDDNSHGTHVAGIAAARGNNGIGIAGVNWYAKINPVKVFKSDGTGDAATISQGISYAANNGATVLNMSFGSYGRSMTMETALQNAYITADLVASAGNNSKSIYSINPMDPTTHYPAALSYVLGVEAIAPFSNYDPDGPILSTFPENFNYELTAPGSGIISTAPNGTYISMSGTSMSAPLVSGAISLYRAQFPSASKEKLWGDFIHTSSDCIKVYDAFYPTNVLPSFDMTDYAIEDTLAGNDQDGQADAGELIQIYTTIRNTWGYADSVYALLSQSIYGDTNDVHLVHDSVFFGSLSTYGTLTNLSNPFLVRIDSNCFNNRNITMNLTMKNAGDAVSYTQEIDFKIYNGEELSGILLNDTTLTPDKLWIITNSLRVSTGVTLTILPGTYIEIYAGIDNRGSINAIGTADSMIYVKGGGFHGNGIFRYIDFDLNQQYININADLDHCNLSNGSIVNANTVSFCTLNNFNDTGSALFSGTDSIFSTNVYNSYAFLGLGCGFFYQCLFDNIIYGHGYNSHRSEYCVFNDFTNLQVYYNPNCPNLWAPEFLIKSDYNSHKKNSFLNNGISIYFVLATGSSNYLNFPNQYWGTTDEDKIRLKYWDFHQDATLPYLIVDPILTAPSDSCPGHVWKVLVNGKDAQDEIVDPVGVGLQKFEVYFNRAMDTTINPLLSFGVRFPYLQNILNDSTSWSTDKKFWTAYYDVGLFTGDGIQTIRVVNAQDSIGNTIPVEDNRFSFVIQAAGVQSMNFTATSGIGKVELEWNNTGLIDFLGFNMYRYMSLTDTTFTNPTIVNSSLIIDTIYTDFQVIPDSTYHYYYKIVDTDLQESDSSNIVSAHPFNAANGDANGDLSVNVLDITTIVAYMLNQNPSPFLFDAADVNYDGQINVLDIIGLVQLISGDKSAPLTAFVDISDQKAFYEINDNKLLLESEGNVAAMQFKFKVQGLKAKVKSVKILNELKIFSMAKGFEFAYAVVDNHIIGILFSLTGKVIPAGDQELFRFEGIDISEIEITEIFGGELNGNYVPVLKKGQQVNPQIPDNFALNVYPNPFYSSTVIMYKLAEESRINISIYDLEGRKLANIINKMQEAGSYSVTWSPKSNFKLQTSNSKVNSGIYICHLEAKTENQTILKDVKIILMR